MKNTFELFNHQLENLIGKSKLYYESKTHQHIA